VAYMSPEQARGEELDARTDLFSLGVVLYEMATGTAPFQGNTTAVIFNEILTKAPVAPVRLNPELPDQLENTINRSLEKDPKLRYQTASDLRSELMRLKRDTSGESVATTAAPAAIPAKKRSYLWPVVTGGVVVLVILALALFWPSTVTAPEEAIDSIAVLPFENLSGDPDLEYVSDGMTQGIISRLSQLSSLNKVISSASMMGYKGKSVDAGTVAEEVDVRAVVMGNMASQGETLRVYVELIDAENNSTLWGETYTRHRSELFELEETLSKEIADALGIQLTGEEGERLSKRYTENSQAHEAYLKGQSEKAKFTVDGVQTAIQYFEEAVERDRNYALVYAVLADSYRMLAQPLGAIPLLEVMPKAEELAMKALELDSRLSEAHAVLGDVKRSYHWDWTAAENEYKLAIELDPNSAWAHSRHAFLMMMLGRHDDAIAQIRRAQQLDPLNLRIRENAVWILGYARQYNQSLEQGRGLLDINPNYQRGYVALGATYEAMGLYEEASAARQAALTLGGASEEDVAGLSDAYATSGEDGYWQSLLDYWTEKAKEEYVSSNRFAGLHAQLGEKDQAFEWLEKAYQERAGGLVFLKVDPRYDFIRSDPRFQDLLRRMNLEP